MKDEDSDDRSLFRETMGDVRPLRRDQVAPERPRPAPRARFTRADNAQVLRDSLDGAPHIDEQNEVGYARPGVPRSVIRQLRRGRYSIGDELDLHGLNAREARTAVHEFIAESRQRRIRCVRIIHGKGTRSGRDGPVLKPRVYRWLRRRDSVLAFSTCRPVDGGTGAVYVLLAD